MIIFINGSFNAGKSTVAKLLAEKLGDTAVVEVDTFHEFISWMPIKESVLVNLENATLIIRNFVKRGFNVIVPHSLSKRNYEYLMEELKEVGDDIKIFTLNPKIEEVLENRGEKELTEVEKERIRYHYSTGINIPTFGEIINNTQQTPEETVESILALIKADK
jgi:cytidylate kinase